MCRYAGSSANTPQRDAKRNGPSRLLESFHLDADTPVSVLAVEMMPRYDEYVVPAHPEHDVMPLSRQLGIASLVASDAHRAARGQNVAADAVPCELATHVLKFKVPISR